MKKKEKSENTTEYTVEVLPEDQVEKIVDISAITIDVTPQKRPHELTEKEENNIPSIEPIAASTFGKSGTNAVDVHGPKKVNETETTLEQMVEAATMANADQKEESGKTDSER